MNVNNLMIVIVDCALLSLDERDKMFYKTFESIDDTIKHIRNVMETDIDDDEVTGIYFYGINQFLKELNANECPLMDDYVIPIFVKNADTEQPNVLVDKLTQEVQSVLKTQENVVKTNFTRALDDVYQNALQEIKYLMEKHYKCVKVMDDTYTLEDDGVILKNGKVCFENIYGMCEIFDSIKKTIESESEKKDDVNSIVDKILSMDVDRITTIMRHIGKFGGYEEIRNFDEIGSMLIVANAKGFDVKVELECGRDYYAYGVIENEVYVIRGLVDERKEFEEILDIYNTAQIILNSKDYIEFVNECYDEWKAKRVR